MCAVGILASLALGLAAAAAPIRPSYDQGVVAIDSTLGYLQGSLEGTGLVLTSWGEVLTNNHVILGATSIRVVVPGGHAYRARVVGYDVGADIAVLQLDGASHLATVTPARVAATVGAPVTAVGNAEGVGRPTRTTGAIVSEHRSITVTTEMGGFEALRDLIESSTALQPGDSGGALLDAEGHVIGMNTAATNLLDSPLARGFAIPIRAVLRVAARVEAGHQGDGVHSGETSFLGVYVQPAPTSYRVGQAAPGALVVGIIGSSPAARAGLSDGDVISSLAGHPVSSFSAVSKLLLGYKPGTWIVVSWVDADGVSHRTRVRLASGPPL